MMIIGVDYHPSFQTIAFLMEETGEYDEQRVNHDGEAERFYRDLKQRGIRVRVGMEATGFSRWFEQLLAELGFELWIGDPAERLEASGYDIPASEIEAGMELHLPCLVKVGQGNNGYKNIEEFLPEAAE